MNGNRKLFWKEASNAKGENVQSCSRMKDENRRLALEELEVRSTWKEYFEDLYNIDTQELVAVHMCSFDGVRRGNYVGGELIRGTEVEVRVEKIKKGKAAGKDEVTGEMIKS